MNLGINSSGGVTRLLGRPRGPVSVTIELLLPCIRSGISSNVLNFVYVSVQYTWGRVLLNNLAFSKLIFHVNYYWNDAHTPLVFSVSHSPF